MQMSRERDREARNEMALLTAVVIVMGFGGLLAWGVGGLLFSLGLATLIIGVGANIGRKIEPK